MNHNDDILDPIPERAGSHFVWIAALLGLLIGLGFGLYYALEIDPVQIRNVAPGDLRPGDKQFYVVSIAQEYASDGDLARAVERFLEVQPDSNPFDLADQTVCDLIRSGRVETVSDVTVIRNLRAIYESQGFVSSCDTSAFNTPVPVTIVVPTATITPPPTITPVATKTPTQPFSVPGNTPLPSGTPASTDGTIYRQQFAEQFCDPALSGIIEVYVRDFNNVGLPGIGVEVSWDNGQEREIFFTGLKPEHGDDYADFDMAVGQSYRLEIADAESELSQPLEAVICDAAGTLRSYRVVIQKFDVQPLG